MVIDTSMNDSPQTVDLGWFIRYVTAFLDDGNKENIRDTGGCKYAPLILNGEFRLFPLDKLDKLLRNIQATFYKAYGGWKMELYFGAGGIFTGEAAFKTAV